MYARKQDQRGVQPPRQSFASFVFGPESLLAYHAAHTAATQPGTIVNPLYLIGGRGTGKTHLLKAIAGQLAEQPALPGILYFSATAFNQEFTSALRLHRANTLVERLTATGALLIDDLPLLTEHAPSTAALAAVITSLRAQQRQVVLCGERHPDAIRGLPDHFRALLHGGFIAHIGKPSLRTNLALARTFASYAESWFSEDSLHMLAYHATSGIGQLAIAVRRCALLAGHGNVVDAALAKHVCHDLLRQAHDAPVPSTMDAVLHAVCTEFGISKDCLLSTDRSAPVSQARQVAMLLLREDAGLTVECIGRELGRDHSTVLHGCRRVQTALACNNESIVAALGAVRRNLLDALA